MEFVHNIDFMQIEIGKVLGGGTFGVVYQGLWKGQKKVALKKFRRSDGIENEIVQLSRARHPNIIELFGVTSDGEQVYLIMEYAENGSLSARLHHNVLDYSRVQALNWALQCAEAIAYLHNRTPPILHRDLKPDNLLLTDDERQLKICDFGLVTNQRTVMSTERGTLCYMAPEVFAGGNYNTKCDVFSWSLILWELLERERPFKEFSSAYAVQIQLRNGKRPELSSVWSPALKQLLTRGWAQEPALRPTMDEIVAQLRRVQNDTEDFEFVDEGLHATLVPNGPFVRPQAKIDILPIGFSVSIPDMLGIELFAFHGKLNEKMVGVEAGTWSEDVLEAENGRWTYTNQDAQLKSGDKIYYWTMIHHKGIGYREPKIQSFEVKNHA